MLFWYNGILFFVQYVCGVRAFVVTRRAYKLTKRSMHDACAYSLLYNIMSNRDIVVIIVIIIIIVITLKISVLQ